MKRIGILLILVAILSTGCFGNTLVMTAGGYGIGFHVNPTNLTAAVGRFDFNIVDSELAQEQLKIKFSQDGTSSLAHLFGLDTGLFSDGEHDAAIAYESYMELELTPLFALPDVPEDQ